MTVLSGISAGDLTPDQLASTGGLMQSGLQRPNGISVMPDGLAAGAPTPPNQGQKLQGEVKQSQTNATEYNEASPSSNCPENYIRGGVRFANPATVDNDPDAQDRELSIEWDRWRNRFLQAVLTSTTELLNNDQSRSFQFNPNTNVIESKYPLGTTAWFICTITNDRQIKNPRIVRSSGFADYDQAVIEAVKEMADSSILKFPSASKRLSVLQGGGIERSAQPGQEYFHFGDVERYRLPAY